MQAILFDFGGTLDDPRHWLDRFLGHYHAAGIAISRAELDHAYAAATQSAYGAGAAIREFGIAELLDYLVGLQFDYLREHGPRPVRQHLEVAAGEGRVDALRGQIAAAFAADSRAGLARSREVLASLAGRYRLGVVSNFYGNLDRILAQAGIAPLIGAIADSARLGIYKPDAAIFTTALEQLGVAAGAAAMVGDSLDKDCAPARRLGLTTVWLRHGMTRDDDPAPAQAVGDADFTIGALAELETLIWPAA
jgi:putative hydrolase of the HAD superfamily